MICSNSPTHGAKPYPKRLIACNGKNRRMRLLTLILIITVWLPGTACAGAALLKNVMIISIDALHPAALGPKTTPTIYEVMTEGTYTLEGRSTNPPKTLISYSAMFTGVGPDEAVSSAISGSRGNRRSTGPPFSTVPRKKASRLDISTRSKNLDISSTGPWTFINGRRKTPSIRLNWV